MRAILWTPRLRLRPITEGDRALYVALYGDADVMRHIAPPMPDARAGHAFDVVLRRTARPFPADRYWVAELHRGTEGLGLVALQVQGDHAEWGVMLRAERQRHGYALEALGAVTDAAFDTGAIERITIRCRRPLAGCMDRIAIAGGYRPSGPVDGLEVWVRP